MEKKNISWNNQDYLTLIVTLFTCLTFQLVAVLRHDIYLVFVSSTDLFSHYTF